MLNGTFKGILTEKLTQMCIFWSLWFKALASPFEVLWPQITTLVIHWRLLWVFHNLVIQKRLRGVYYRRERERIYRIADLLSRWMASQLKLIFHFSQQADSRNFLGQTFWSNLETMMSCWWAGDDKEKYGYYTRSGLKASIHLREASQSSTSTA